MIQIQVERNEEKPKLREGLFYEDQMFDDKWAKKGGGSRAFDGTPLGKKNHGEW